MSRVGIIGKNSFEYINILLEIWNKGDCAVLIDWRMPVLTITSLLEQTNVEICYIEECMLKNEMFEKNKRIKFISFVGNSDGFFKNELYSKYKKNRSKNEALILFSSGTTGNSKGIIHTHYSIDYNSDAIIRSLKISKSDSLYIIKSFNHSSTIVGEILVSLKCRVTAYIPNSSTTLRKHLQNISRKNISVLVLTPTLLNLIISTYQNQHSNYIFKNMRLVCVCGEAASTRTLKMAKKVFNNANIINMYGLTEAGPRVAIEERETLSGSAGKAIKGTKIKILSSNGKKIRDGTQGLIWIKSKSMMKGYVDEKELNRKKWFNTNDIGYLKNGNLFLVGRADNMFVKNGRNIYPEKIEKKIEEHPFINECLIKFVGVNSKKILAFYSTCNNVPLTNSELVCVVNRLKKELSNYECPDRYIHVNDIPKTSNGKKNRAERISNNE